MAWLALRAALAATTSSVALALHTAVNGRLQEAFGPSEGSLDGAATVEVPAAVLDDLEGRRRELERLHDDTEPGAVALVKQHRLQKERSLWLSGKSRQALTNYNDVQYIGFIGVGGQTISAILDTGSFAMVVFSEVCKTCGQAANYHPALSASHTQGKLRSSLGYGSGTVVLQEAFDIVSVGPYAPRNQSFWEVTEANMPVLATSTFQCIMGLGPPEAPLVDAEARLASIHNDMSTYTDRGLSLPSDLVKAEANMRGIVVAMQTNTMVLETFESRMFSVCMGRQPKSNGYVIWSDTAPLVKPEYFQRVPVTGNHTWSTMLEEPQFAFDPAAKDKQSGMASKYEGLTIGCDNGCGALLDSGTSLLALPGTVINELVKLTFEPDFNCSNMWELPSLKIKLGGQEIILPPDMYVAEVEINEVPAYLQSFVRLRRLAPSKESLAPSRESLERDAASTSSGVNVLGRRRSSLSQRPGARCDLMVMETKASTVHGPLWILGIPFFRQYYTTFEVSGRSNKARAVHIAKASDTCHPASPDESPKFPPRTQLYRRLIDPTKLWVAPSTYNSLSSDFVFL
jgi:hypothetical protein